eukprot:7101706-Prorocentrum_lima.AAC.1
MVRRCPILPQTLRCGWESDNATSTEEQRDGGSHPQLPTQSVHAFVHNLAGSAKSTSDQAEHKLEHPDK